MNFDALFEGDNTYDELEAQIAGMETPETAFVADEDETTGLWED